MVFRSHPNACHCRKCLKIDKEDAARKQREATAKRLATLAANKKRA